MGRQIGLLILLILATPHSLYSQQSSELAKEHYQRGDTYLQEGRYKEAQEEFQKALDLLGKKESFSVMALAEKGAQVQALSGSQDNKGLSREHYQKGNAYLLEGKYREAQEEFRKALELLGKKDEIPAVSPPHKLLDVKPHEQ
jgi:tetratricopeptide (TPR) repeat protein